MVSMNVPGLTEWAAAVGLLLRGALTLDAQAFRQLYATPFEHHIALGVLLFAALSEAIGQSVALFLHRVSPKRFAFSLLLTALLFVFTVFLWTAVFWTISRFAFGRDYAFYDVLAGVSLGHAPWLFGFLVLFPWVGLVIRAVLQVWTLLAVIVSLIELRMPLRDLLFAAVPGWLIVEALYRLPGSPLRWVNTFLDDVIYNSPDRITTGSLREMLLRSIHNR